MFKKTLLVLAIGFMLTGCGKSDQGQVINASGTRPQVGNFMSMRDVVLTIDDEESVDGAFDFYVTNVRDSRCPSGALCVRTGEAVVTLAVRDDRGKVTDYELGTQPSAYTNHVAFDGYKITLKSVNPFPKEGEVTDQSDYQVSFNVAKSSNGS